MTDDRMLEKVRKLLSKAERAGSEHEAEAFTAKATELMLKYAIDEALLQSHGEKRDEKIVVHRVEVKGYAKAKLNLMHRVAAGLGLRSVQYTNSRAGWSTGSGEVVGWESDVEAFKVLFASLQMQAASEGARELAKLKVDFDDKRALWVDWCRRQREVLYQGLGGYADWDAADEWERENPKPENPGAEPPHGRSFMQSFLIGYGNVVGSRLYRQRTTLIEEADTAEPGTAIAVRDRKQAVDDEYNRRHNPEHFVKGRAASTSSNAGYYAGRSAGERANLGGQSIGGGRRAIGR